MKELLTRLNASTLGTIVSYAFFGGTAFLIDAGTLWLLRDVVGLPAWIGAFIAFCVATVYSFSTQQRITFKSAASTSHSAVRYGILLAANSLFTTGIVHWFDVSFDMYMVGKVLGTALMSIWNYFLFKYWVFPQKTSR